MGLTINATLTIVQTYIKWRIIANFTSGYMAICCVGDYVGKGIYLSFGIHLRCGGRNGIDWGRFGALRQMRPHALCISCSLLLYCNNSFLDSAKGTLCSTKEVICSTKEVLCSIKEVLCCNKLAAASPPRTRQLCPV